MSPLQFLVVRLGLVAAAALLFALSLPVAAVHWTPGSNASSYLGFHFFLCGWAGPCNPTPLYAWYGNPFFGAGCLALAFARRPVLAASAGVLFALGLAVALDSLRLRTTGLTDNEGGAITLHFRSFAPGFYLWLASYGAGMLGSVLALVLGLRAAEQRESGSRGARGAHE